MLYLYHIIVKTRCVGADSEDAAVSAATADQPAGECSGGHHKAAGIPGRS